jgi:hypothetical protein
MNKKTMTLVALGLSIAAITYVTYRSLGQLQDIEYDLFATEEDDD